MLLCFLPRRSIGATALRYLACQDINKQSTLRRHHTCLSPSHMQRPESAVHFTIISKQSPSHKAFANMASQAELLLPEAAWHCWCRSSTKKHSGVGEPTVSAILYHIVVLQAEQQLGPGWTLMRSGTPKCPEIQDWLASTLPQGGRVGIDPFLHTVSLLNNICFAY